MRKILTPLEKEARKVLKALGSTWKLELEPEPNQSLSVCIRHKTRHWSITRVKWENEWVARLVHNSYDWTLYFSGAHEDPLTALLLAKKQARKKIRAIQELIKD